jgi:hypothetical protein
MHAHRIEADQGGRAERGLAFLTWRTAAVIDWWDNLVVEDELRRAMDQELRVT